MMYGLFTCPYDVDVPAVRNQSRVCTAENPTYKNIDKQVPLVSINAHKDPGWQLPPSAFNRGGKRVWGWGGKGAMCLQSSNKGVGVENDLRFPILYPAGTPLNTLSLGIDSLSVSVGCTLQSKGPI